MTRRVYQVIFLASIIGFTILFAKEIKGVGNLFPHVDKVAHFGIFFILALVMDKAFKLPLMVQILLLAGYGAPLNLCKICCLIAKPQLVTLSLTLLVL